MTPDIEIIAPEPREPARPRCPTCRDDGRVFYERTCDDLSGLWTKRPYPVSMQDQRLTIPTEPCPDCGEPKP